VLPKKFIVDFPFQESIVVVLDSYTFHPEAKQVKKKSTNKVKAVDNVEELVMYEMIVLLFP